MRKTRKGTNNTRKTTCGDSSKTWPDWAKPMWYSDSAHQIHQKWAKISQTTNLLLTSVIHKSYPDLECPIKTRVGLSNGINYFTHHHGRPEASRAFYTGHPVYTLLQIWENFPAGRSMIWFQETIWVISYF